MAAWKEKSTGEWGESRMEGFEFRVGERYFLSLEMTKRVIPNECEESYAHNKISPFGRNDKWGGFMRLIVT